MQASTSQTRQYQGYPNSNPFVVDAPSIDAATAVRWSDLPRTKVLPPTPRDVNQQVVYIDIPEEAGPSGETQSPDRPRPSLPDKKEPDDTPVVYIDLPDQAGGSGVSQNREEAEESEEPSFVQETIFYDPFENRRIDLSKSNESVRSNRSVNSESDVESVHATTPSGLRPVPSGLRPAPRPPRPDTLELFSSTQAPAPVASTPSFSPMTPSPLSWPSDGYHSRHDTPESVFPSPISASEFPEPPPAYTEYNAVRTPPAVAEQPRLQDQQAQLGPPRTQVILPEQGRPLPIGMPNVDRKYLNCHHCGMRVHTLVVREIGSITHLIALVCFILCLPVAVLVYCMDCVKNKNHYCPNCNKLIGYQLPLGQGKIVYVN